MKYNTVLYCYLVLHCVLLLCTAVQTVQYLGITRVLYNYDTVPARTLLLYYTWYRIMHVPAYYS
jgi:hypothetical protein